MRNILDFEKSISDLQDKIDNYDIILSRLRIDNNINANYHLKYYSGWADNYTLIYHDNVIKYFNDN